MLIIFLIYSDVLHLYKNITSFIVKITETGRYVEKLFLKRKECINKNQIGR